MAILLGGEPFSATEKPETTNPEQTAYSTEREILSDVFFYNLMGAGPQEPLGTFSLQGDGTGLDLSYPDNKKLGDWAVFKRQEAVLKSLNSRMAETGHTPTPKLMLSPFWTAERRVTVVHPLGGAPMGPDSAHGAVDSLGRLYDGSQSGTAVLRGLYVVDASVIPGALGVNPP